MSIAVERSVLGLRSARSGVLARADLIALGGLALFVATLLTLTWRAWGDLDSDTGYDMVAAGRIADGEVPYRDFVYYYGPLAPTLGALLQLVGLSPMSAAIALGLVVTTAILCATYLLGRAFSGVLGASLATAVTATVALIPSNYNFVLPHTAAATSGLLCVLVLLIALGRAQGSSRTTPLLVAGTAIGLALLTKPEPAAAGLAIAVAWIVVNRPGSSSRRALAHLTVPALGIPALVYGVLAAVAGVRTLLLENLYPQDALDAGGDVLVRVRLPLTLESIVEIGARTVIYAIGCALIALAALMLARGGRARAAVSVAIGAGAVAAGGLSLLRPEALRHGLEYVYAWIPAGALLALVVLVVQRRRGSASSAAADRDIVALTGLAVLALSTYGAFYLYAPHPQMAVYAAPLAAIFLTRLHLRELALGRAGVVLGAAWVAFLAAAGTGLVIKDARLESEIVRGPGGSIAETPVEAALYRSALGWIARETRAGDQILVAPLLTGLYPLSNRTSPLDEISLIPGALPSEADEQRAIELLDAARVPLVITDDREWPGYGHTSFGGSFDRRLAAWVSANYRRAAVIVAPAHEAFDGNRPERTLSVWLRGRK